MAELNRRDFLKMTSKGALAASVPGSQQIDQWIENMNQRSQVENAGSKKSGQNAISLPEGGGAVRGIGESFQVNPHTGTGNFSVPVAITPGREDFGPKLSMSYSTGFGNGPFGQGWSLSVPEITRKTE